MHEVERSGTVCLGSGEMESAPLGSDVAGPAPVGSSKTKTIPPGSDTEGLAPYGWNKVELAPLGKVVSSSLTIGLTWIDPC